MTSQQASIEATTSRVNSHRILIVDDEANIRSSFGQALFLSGYDVDVAEGGSDALSKLTIGRYDLLLLDLQMPDLDGLTVLRSAHAAHPDLMIMILTGHPDLQSAIAALRSEAVDYLRKPVGAGQLIASVRCAFQEREQRLQQRKLMQSLLKAGDVLRTVPTAPNPVRPESLVRVGPLAMNKAEQRAYLADGDTVRPLDLATNEILILMTLSEQPGRIVSCRRLAYRILGQEVDQCTAANMVRPLIFRLRRKLEPSSKQPRLIRTARGGYFLTTGQNGFE
jgi:two-component system KDP operon response regulator KdpE